MTESAVSVRGLEKRYGSVLAVASLDLEIPRSSIFGLLGPNGAGKSTTFGILCGWLRATAGEARVLGVDPRQLWRLRGRVAALPQDARFPSQISVLRQLGHYGRLAGLSASAADRSAAESLERVGLAHAAGLRGHELSHGMLKRAGLAQALIGAPELIFLDEPISGLDPKTARHIKDLLASLAPQATVVLSSHQLADVEEICTHGAILDHGRLAAAGSMAELTREGSEVAIELDASSTIPLEALHGVFGADRVTLDGRTLRIASATDEESEAAVRSALRILLDADVGVQEVRRGTSLEDAFLAATSAEERKQR